MRHYGTLTPRHFEVLHALVENYIETGEPVASRTVARKHTLSAASIRNMMADLADNDYLSQPHTSAGRIPTERGFKAYAKTLATSRLVRSELDRLQGELGRAGTVEGRVERSSQLLTELTRNFGIAAAIPGENQTLDQIELVPLPDRRVLMVVITKDKMVRNRVVLLDAAIAPEDLVSIRNYINFNFSGWSIISIHRELKRRFELESAAYDAILKRVSMLYSLGLLDVSLAPEVYFEGAGNLIGLDLHLTRERMRELFQALEEKKRILHLLERYLEQPLGQPGIQVGLAEAHPSMSELSIIGMRIELPNGMAANVAVVGPMRMNYQRAVSAVMHVGEAFRSFGN
jgi:heat-inducible transcriptional repressor